MYITISIIRIYHLKLTENTHIYIYYLRLIVIILYYIIIILLFLHFLLILLYHIQSIIYYHKYYFYCIHILSFSPSHYIVFIIPYEFYVSYIILNFDLFKLSSVLNYY
jgi:hypothetical protein